MARSRVVRPEFWDDEKLASIPLEARLIFIGMWNYSDDYGVVKGATMWLRNKILPYDSVQNGDFSHWLQELEQIKAIIPFEANGEHFYYIRNFLKYQKVNRPSDKRNPIPPPSITGDSRHTHDILSGKTEFKQKQKQSLNNTCAVSECFQKFWKAYPKKKSKGDAEKAFKAIKPDEQLLATMIATIERAKTSEQWQKDNGQFIPYPATWLRAKGWEDECTPKQEVKFYTKC